MVKPKSPTFLKGYLYFPETDTLISPKNLLSEFRKVKKVDLEPEPLINGVKIPLERKDKRDKKSPTHRLKYDIQRTSDYYQCYFSGFLYPDNTINGKIKYVRESNEPDDIFSGIFIKSGKNKLVIHGNWIDSVNSSDSTSCFMELS